MESKQFKVNNDSALWKGAAAGLVARFVGSWVKSKVEPPMQKVGEKPDAETTEAAMQA